jgi:hypothetical protein
MTDMQRYAMTGYDSTDAWLAPDENGMWVTFADAEAAIAAAEEGHRYECRLSEGGHDVSLDGMRCIDCDAECICGYTRGQRDMLAKCIGAVDKIAKTYPSDSISSLRVLAALRALKEQP